MPTIPSLPTGRRMKLWPGKSDKNGNHSPDGDNDDKENSNSAQATEDDDVKQPGTATASGLLSSGSKDESARPLAEDIKARKLANDRFYTSAEAFHSSLVKRKPVPFDFTHQIALETAMVLDEASSTSASVYPSSSSLVAEAAREGSANLTNSKDKLLPVEALGLGMATASSTYGKATKGDQKADGVALSRNGAYASHLAHLAAMHLALGQAQSEFAEQMSSTLLSRLARTQATVESLRLAEKACHMASERMEQAEKKRNKARERGEGKRELEEEARLARATYEDAQADVQTRVTLLTETERAGPNAGVEVVKEYVGLLNDWIERQQSIVSSVHTALEQYKDSQGTGTVRSLTGRQFPAIPKRLDTEDSHSGDQRSPSESPRIAQRPPVPTRGSHAGSVKTISSRPPSRGSIQGKANDKVKSNKRSDSFSSVNDTKGNSGSGFTGNGRAHSGSIGSKLSGKITNALMRSSSSVEVPKASPTPSPAASVQKQESGSSGEGKTGGWTSSILTLKRDRSYKTMDSAETNAILGAPHHHERDLSHVREGTDEIGAGQNFVVDRRESETMLDTHDSLGLDPTPLSRSSTGFDGQHDGDFGYSVQNARRPSDYRLGFDRSLSPNQGHLFVPDSAALGAQWTGMTNASSDGGDPFGSSTEQEALWTHEKTNVGAR